MKKLAGRAFLTYIRILAKIQLLKHLPHIVGITGSAGKTSTRNAVHSVLQENYYCKVTGKANSESGIPLDILGLEITDYSFKSWVKVSLLAIWKLFTNWERYDVYIVEMGIDSPDEPKNMSYLLKIFKPDTGIFINALPVHSEPFDYLAKSENPEERRSEIIQLIAHEKGKMITSLNEASLAILNIDDPAVAQFKESTKAKVCRVGHGEADIQIGEVKISLNGFSAQFTYRGATEQLKIADQLFGKDYAMTFGLAIAAGINLGIPFRDCIRNLQSYKLPAGRMSLIKGVNETLIIDSSYNASTHPMLTALETLVDVGKDKSKVAVLGDMREMGLETQHEHEIIAEKAVKCADFIVLAGPAMRDFFMPKAIELGFNEKNIKWFERADLASDFIKNSLIKGGEIVLVKASQNTLFFERIVEDLMLEKDRADELLCRRGAYWDRQRAKIFTTL